MPHPSKILILSGAGLSAESGLSTFRDEGGLWAQHRIEDVATPEAFARDPDTVLTFYNTRRAQAAEAQPNAAHRALARLQKDHPGEVILVTQNVDDLLEKAGAAPLHMHGALHSSLCAACDHRWPDDQPLTRQTPCPACRSAAARPDIVWFGEIPYHMDEITAHLETADLFVSIGTSGQVYPAAGFVQMAHEAGAETLEINMEPTNPLFRSRILGPATRTVPAWVEDLLGG